MPGRFLPLCSLMCCCGPYSYGTKHRYEEKRRTKISWTFQTVSYLIFQNFVNQLDNWSELDCSDIMIYNECVNTSILKGQIPFCTIFKKNLSLTVSVNNFCIFFLHVFEVYAIEVLFCYLILGIWGILFLSLWLWIYCSWVAYFIVVSFNCENVINS